VGRLFRFEQLDPEKIPDGGNCGENSASRVGDNAEGSAAAGFFRAFTGAATGAGEKVGFF